MRIDIQIFQMMTYHYRPSLICAWLIGYSDLMKDIVILYISILLYILYDCN